MDEFHEMTPKEFNFYAECYTEKMEREQREKMELTWLGAYFQRVEELHPLEHYLNKAKQEQSNAMTPDEMMLKVMELNAKMGGTVVQPGGEE